MVIDYDNPHTRMPASVWSDAHIQAAAELLETKDALARHVGKVMARHARRVQTPEWRMLPKEEREERAQDVADYCREMRGWQQVTRSAELQMMRELKQKRFTVAGS